MADTLPFEDYGSRFVAAYWYTIKSGEFPMPGDEPMVRPLDEILAEVTWNTTSTSARNARTSVLSMMGEYGDSWRFEFESLSNGWEIVSYEAGGHRRSVRGNLLDDPVYRHFHRPWLQEAAKLANDPDWHPNERETN
jgi:hypothetical protein